jgi:DNA-binding transcriptional LysR family regulator
MSLRKSFRLSVSKQHGEFTQINPIQMQANNAEAINPALLAGLGMALQAEFLAWNGLQSGVSETARDDWEVEPLSLHIVASGRRRPIRVQTLIDYIRQILTEEPWAHFIEGAPD